MPTANTCQNDKLGKGLQLLWEGPRIPKAIIPLSNLYREPEDCRPSAWSEWSKCSAACNGGIRKRTRTLLEPAPAGATCPDLTDYGLCKIQPCSCEQECINTPNCHGYSSKLPTATDAYPRCRLFSESQPIANMNRKVKIEAGGSFTPPADQTAFSCHHHPGWLSATVMSYSPGSCNVDVTSRISKQCVGQRECNLSQELIKSVKANLVKSQICAKVLNHHNAEDDNTRFVVQAKCKSKSVSAQGVALAAVTGYVTSKRGPQDIVGEMVVNETNAKEFDFGTEPNHPNVGFIAHTTISRQKIGIGYSRLIQLPPGPTSLGFKFKSNTGRGRVKV